MDDNNFNTLLMECSGDETLNFMGMFGDEHGFNAAIRRKLQAGDGDKPEKCRVTKKDHQK